MAITTAKQLPFASLITFNALMPELGRTEDKTLRWAGRPCEVWCIVNNTTTTDYNLQTTLKAVQNGIVYNVTDDEKVSTLVITPLSTDPSKAVITGDLTASKTYLVFVVGRLD